MQRIVNQAKHRWFGPRSFYKEAILVMLPVAIQQMVSSLFNFVDNLMVGQVDAPSMAGVAIANKLFIIFSGLFWGICGAGAMLISQFYGADDREECERLFVLQIVVGLTLGVLFTVLLTLFPLQIMVFFNSDPQTVQKGLEYISTVRFSYIPAALTMVGLFSMRAIGHNKMPLVAGIGAMITNVVLNWILIFGHFGFEPMGAKGAGLATFIARMVEALMYIGWIAAGRTIFSWNLFSLRHMSRHVLAIAARKALPLMANEFLYTAGLSAMFWSFSRIDPTAVSALVISDQSTSVLMVLFGGMGTGVSIMVGTRLGAGQFDQAKLNARLLMVFQGLLALGITFVTLAAAPFIPRMFAVSGELQQLATRLIMIHALFIVVSIVYANIFFVLRAGGDIRSAFVVDAAMMWLLPIPVLAAIAVFKPADLAFSLPLAYLINQVLFNIKIVPAFKFLRQGHWVKNLTAR